MTSGCLIGLQCAAAPHNRTSLPSTEQGDRPLVADADSEHQEAVASVHSKATRHSHLDNRTLDPHMERERKQVQVWSGYNIIGASYLGDIPSAGESDGECEWWGSSPKNPVPPILRHASSSFSLIADSKGKIPKCMWGAL